MRSLRESGVLNTPSTPSRLISVRLPPFPIPPPSPTPPRFGTNDTDPPRIKPLPSLEGCGLKCKCCSSCRTDPAPPFPEGCGRGGSFSLDEEFGDGNTQGETQEVGDPSGASRNTSHDVCRGSLSLSILPSSPTDGSNAPTRTRRHPDTVTTPQQPVSTNERSSMTGTRVRQRR